MKHFWMPFNWIFLKKWNQVVLPFESFNRLCSCVNVANLTKKLYDQERSYLLPFWVIVMAILLPDWSCGTNWLQIVKSDDHSIFVFLSGSHLDALDMGSMLQNYFLFKTCSMAHHGATTKGYFSIGTLVIDIIGKIF